jgi:hypothetical protein
MYVYRIGGKIIDTKEGSQLFVQEKEKSRVAVGLQAAGKVTSTFLDFTSEELAQLVSSNASGVEVENGIVYLRVTQEDIGHYELNPPGGAEDYERVTPMPDKDSDRALISGAVSNPFAVNQS